MNEIPPQGQENSGGWKIEKQELDRLVEAGELERERFDVNVLFYLAQDAIPIERKTLGKQAIVLSAEELEFLSNSGGFEIIAADGQEMPIDPNPKNFEPGELFILLPKHLGDL